MTTYCADVEFQLLEDHGIHGLRWEDRKRTIRCESPEGLSGTLRRMWADFNRRDFHVDKLYKTSDLDDAELALFIHAAIS